MTPLSSRAGGDEAGRRRHAGELHPSAPPSSIELCTPPPSFPHCLALVPIGACVQQTSVCGRREPQIHAMAPLCVWGCIYSGWAPKHVPSSLSIFAA